MLLPVVNAPLVLVNVIKDKLPARNAVRVNSMMLLVRLNAQCVHVRLSLVKKEETAVAWIAQWVGCPKMGVLNVSCVVQVRLEVVVKVVPLGTLEMAPIQMRHNVGIVNWVKQHRLLVPRLVRRVTRVKSVFVVVIVWRAPVVFTKTTKVKITASNATGANRLSMLKPPAVIVTKVNMAVTMALVLPAQLVIFKIPKVKRSAVTLVPRLAKYPTTNAPDVNCHRGVPAKWVNI